MLMVLARHIGKKREEENNNHNLNEKEQKQEIGMLLGDDICVSVCVNVCVCVCVFLSGLFSSPHKKTSTSFHPPCPMLRR